MIKLSLFSGERPKVEPLNLSNEQASYCRDCYLHSSGMDALRGGKFVRDGATFSDTIYKAGNKLIVMDDWTDFVRSPIITDKFERIYYTQRGFLPPPGLFVTSYNELQDNVQGVNLSLIVPPDAAPTANHIGQGLKNVSFLVDYITAGAGNNSQVSEKLAIREGEDDVIISFPSAASKGADSVNVYAVFGPLANPKYYLMAEAGEDDESITFLDFELDTSSPVAGFLFTTLSYDAPTASLYKETADLNSTNFVVTYITVRDEETAPSPLSETIWYKDGVDAVNLVLPTSTNAQYVSMRVYMAIDGDYYAVAEVPIGQATLLIDPLDDDLIVNAEEDPNTIVGTRLTTQTYDPPPEDLIGLIGLPNGVMAGFTNDGDGEVTGTVHFSEPYQPHAWPVDYRIKIKYKIEALAVVPEGLLVLTRGKPSLITGSTPEVMDEHTLESQQSCTDYRAVVSIGDAVCWASPDGVAVYGGRSIKVLSEDVWSREQWQALQPYQMIMGLYEGRLMIYPIISEEGILYDIKRGDITRLSEGAVRACLYDVETDALYVARGDNVELFNEGELLEAQWVSKPHIVPAARTFNSARLIAEAPTQVLLYKADNDYLMADEAAPFWTKDITVGKGQRPFRVKSAGRMRAIRYGFIIPAAVKNRVRAFELAQDMRELV